MSVQFSARLINYNGAWDKGTLNWLALHIGRGRHMSIETHKLTAKGVRVGIYIGGSETAPVL